MWRRDPATGRLVPKMKHDARGVLVVERNARGELVPVPEPKFNEATGRQEDPLGLLARFPSLARQLRQPGSWLSLIGVMGILLAFGHSILAMSGEETLAQVYREVESPKLPNFKKAAFVVFVYSLVLTAGISFLAVLLIPDELRMKDYSDNLIGGLAMHVVGPPLARLALNAFVVVVGFLILAGAVNTAIIGSNGVLNRVAEDGVLPDWFLKPHSRYGTTYRMLYLIVGIQLFTIIVSWGNIYTLGEAYAFGVVWSFVFKALAMIVLRFRDRTPREFKVPFNVKIGGVELPIGLAVVFLVLLTTAILNVFTKEVATLGGVAFTAVFLVVFIASEHYHERRRGAGGHHKHLEQFNVHSGQEITPEMLRLAKPYRKLVAIRSTQNLFMLEQALAETDPDTTDVVVMTAHRSPPGDVSTVGPNLDYYDRDLMTAVVERAEKAGKEVRPLILPTNNPLFAVVQTASNLDVQELILGASNLFTADTQLDQVALYWIDLHGGEPRPLTVRLLSRSRDIYFDLGGGNRIPKISERRARSVAELRAAGVGVRRVLLVHSATAEGSDLFGAVLTMLDPLVWLTVVPVTSADQAEPSSWLQHDLERAHQLHREVEVSSLPGKALAAEIVQRARDVGCDMVIVGAGIPQETATPLDVARLLHDAPCRVALISSPSLPEEVDATPPETKPAKRRM
jgi:nucleotide-binding universal stress UspA family protein